MLRNVDLNEEPDLPLEHYPELSVEQILTRSLSLSREEVNTVVQFERRHQNRKIVFDTLERIAA